ncbi:hypothetical protein F5146DRAFT_1144783 [Armillaria mellea]|nr:hypothetical protein F5146DRAFT_1144783 [Armillaria mellea]
MSSRYRRGCLKSPMGSLCLDIGQLQKYVGFRNAGNEEVYMADEWIRTPSEPARSLSYPDVLELKAIQCNELTTACISGIYMAPIRGMSFIFFPIKSSYKQSEMVFISGGDGQKHTPPARYGGVCVTGTLCGDTRVSNHEETVVETLEENVAHSFSSSSDSRPHQGSLKRLIFIQIVESGLRDYVELIFALPPTAILRLEGPPDS